MQRNKGATFERLIAFRFRECIGLDSEDAKNIRRGLGQARGAGEIADVPVPHLWNECKHHAKAYPVKAHAQAVKAEAEWRERTQSTSRRFPVAICKSNRLPITATLTLSDLADLTGVTEAPNAGSLSNLTMLVTLDFADFLTLYRRYFLANETIR